MNFSIEKSLLCLDDFIVISPIFVNKTITCDKIDLFDNNHLTQTFSFKKFHDDNPFFRNLSNMITPKNNKLSCFSLKSSKISKFNNHPQIVVSEAKSNKLNRILDFNEGINSSGNKLCNQKSINNSKTATINSSIMMNTEGRADDLTCALGINQSLLSNYNNIKINHSTSKLIKSNIDINYTFISQSKETPIIQLNQIKKKRRRSNKEKNFQNTNSLKNNGSDSDKSLKRNLCCSFP